MKEKKFLSALQHVDPELIEEAMTSPTTAKKNWKPVFRGLAAACIGIVFVVFLVRGLSHMGMKSEEPEYTTGAPEEIYPETEEPGEMATTGVDWETVPTGDPQWNSNENFRVMLFTPYGRIEDEAYKENTFAAILQWCEAGEGVYVYEQLWEDSLSDSMFAIEVAVSQGYNVLVFPGADFADVIREAAQWYPDIYFVALHITEAELQQTAGSSYIIPPNVYCVE